MIIAPNKQNRKVLRNHAREALKAYSPVMTWLLQDEDELYIIEEAQGQTDYVGYDCIVATTGDFYKAHGQGAAVDCAGRRHYTQKSYLVELLGTASYNRIFKVSE